MKKLLAVAAAVLVAAIARAVAANAGVDPTALTPETASGVAPWAASSMSSRATASRSPRSPTAVNKLPYVPAERARSSTGPRRASPPPR
jgi:hypothetical protein